MNHEIDELITSYLEEKSTSAETEQLDKWLHEDPDHVRYFFRCKNLHDAYHPGIPPEGIDTRKALRKIMPSASRRVRLLRYWGVAALVLLCIGIPALLFHPLKPKVVSSVQIVTDTSRDTVSEITLTLADGRKINMEKQGTREVIVSGNTVAEIKDNTVNYQPGDDVPVSEAYHVLHVPRGKEYHLTLSDGTKIWVNAGTSITYPVRFAAGRRQIFVEGEIYLEVARDTAAPFTIKMPRDNEVTVLGTSLNIKSYPGEKNDFVTLASGKVKISSVRDRRGVVLVPGEQAVLDNSGKSIVIRKVDPEIYCGWHEGRMIFRNNTLEEILRVLERRYDMDVIWTDESLKAVLFSGEMPVHERVETLLKIIGDTGDVRFTINGKYIVVEKTRE